jgi:Na+-translocating ferredoxin:NAD+ oxidoreductase RnfA subunit
MGACLINIKEEYTFLQALVASFSYAIGFGLALILFVKLFDIMGGALRKLLDPKTRQA